MRHQSQVFDEAAGLAFGGVGRTDDPPLTRLQGTRTGHFSGFLELTVDASHVAKCGNIGESADVLGHTVSFHTKSLDMPVAGAQSMHKALAGRWKRTSKREKIKRIRYGLNL